MTVTKVLKYCEEAVATRWACRDPSDLEIRFFLPDYYSASGQRVFVHPLCAVACDVSGFNRFSESSSNIHEVANILEISEELATLVYVAANGDESRDMKEMDRIMEVRTELVQRIIKQKRDSIHSWWGGLKFRS